MMNRSYRTIPANKMPFASPLVVVSAGEGEKRSFSTYVMFGQFNESPPVIGLGIKENRYTYSLIKEFGEFVVHLVSENMLEVADRAGLFSGRTRDKFKELKIKTLKPRKVKAPVVYGFPIIMECKFVKELPLKDHVLVLGEVIEAYAFEELVEGKTVNVEKASLVMGNYTRVEYLGGLKHIGKWGFSLGI